MLLYIFYVPEPEHDGSTKIYSTLEYSFVSKVNESLLIVSTQEAFVSLICSHNVLYLCSSFSTA